MRALISIMIALSLSTLLNGVALADLKSDFELLENAWSFYLAPRYYVGQNDINTTFSVRHSVSEDESGYLAPQLDSRYGSLYIFGSYEQGYGVFGAPGKLTLRLDSGEIYEGRRSDIEALNAGTSDESVWLTNDGKEALDAFIDGDVVREVYLRQSILPDKSMSIAFGKGRTVVGNGLVYDDFAPFAQFKANYTVKADHTVALMAQAHLLDAVQSESSVLDHMFTGEASLVTKTLRAAIYVSGMQDRGGQLGEMSKDLLAAAVISGTHNGGRVNSMRRRVFERRVSPDSEGHIVWYGAHLSATPLKRVSLWGDVVFSRAEADVRLDLSGYFESVRNGSLMGSRQSRDVDVDFSASGFGGQGGGSLYVGGDWYVSGFGVYIAGNGGLRELSKDLQVDASESRVKQEVANFMSVVPYLGHTNIFFNGGLDQSFSRRDVTLAGVAGRGVAAYGLACEGSVGKRVYVNFGLASLWATHPSPISGSRFYGLELNQAASVKLGGGFSTALQVDVLRTGKFFAERAYNTQTTLQLSYEIGSG